MKTLTKSQVIWLVVSGVMFFVGVFFLWSGTRCTPDVLRLSVSAETDPAEIAKTAESLKLVASELRGHVRVAVGGGLSIAMIALIVAWVIKNRRSLGPTDSIQSIGFIATFIVIAINSIDSAQVSVSAWLCGLIGGGLTIFAGWRTYMVLSEDRGASEAESGSVSGPTDQPDAT
ncbi:MAG: hypothetical protein ABL949_17125 [Fimbriimonadaceae bacterium]